ncbi:MAG TPA: DUF1275 family protein [Phycisphaerae bacterium]|jgi:uncharacterized membrane protein YoaK (UPF0700 family)
MFVSQAHSFRQQARLAVTLAWIAGYTNILTLLRCGTVTSHASGTTSQFGRDLFSGNWHAALFALFLLFTFFVGAAASGFCTEFARRRGWLSIYVFPIIIETLLLGCFAIALEILNGTSLDSGPALFLLTGLASTAMGLQNATITRISDGTVRTTHVTGVLTDIGHETVQFFWWLSDRRMNVPPGSGPALVHSLYTHPTSRRLFLLTSIFATFALGAGLAVLADKYVPRFAMFPPVMFLLWIVYQDLTTPIAEIEASNLVGKSSDWDLPSHLAVFHLRKGVHHKSKVHRMPNLLAWSERLPADARVVILDLCDVTHLDANAASELRKLLQRFASEDRQLIIAGMTSAQFQRIHAGVAHDILSPDNVCTDIELAIARGLNLLETIPIARSQE